MSPLVPEFTLNTGARIPALGFGTWNDAEKQESAVLAALQAGYRHIDTAQVYQTEQAVGAAIKKSGVPRAQIFLTTKIWNNNHHPEDVVSSVEKSLQDLGTDYVDLLLIHYPVAFTRGDELFPLNSDGVAKLGDTDYLETWAALEQLSRAGKARAIGVSNFAPAELERLLAHGSIVPAVHQMELHPYLAQKDFVEWHREKGIHVTQFSSLGNTNPFYEAHGSNKDTPKLLEDPKLTAIGAKYGASPAQTALAWGISHGRSVLSKSVSPERIRQNLAAASISLAPADQQEIDSLDRKARFDDTSKMFGYKFYVGLD